MYKASLGLVGVAAVALIYGWVQQSNPATWFSIIAAIVAGLLLIASWLLERVRGGSAGFSPAGAADASGGGTWTAPAPSSSAWSPAGSSSTSRRSPAEAYEPDFEPEDDGLRGPAAASSVASPERFAPDRFVPEPDATMAMPRADVEEPKRRFGRKAPAPSPTSAVDERVAELRALSESTSAELFSFTEEGDESTESRLARAQHEAEDLLAQPIESFRAPEPPRPAAPPPPPPAPPAPEPVRGAPSHDQDEWLQAAMRRREARRAAGGAGEAPGAPDSGELAPSASASIAPATGPATAWTPPPGAPPPRAPTSAAPTSAATTVGAPASGRSDAPRLSASAPAAPPAATPAPPPAARGTGSVPASGEEEGETLTWSQRRRRTRLGAEPAPDYELREVPAAAFESRRRSRVEEPDEEASFELIPVPGEELPEELPEELAAEEEEEEEAEEVVVRRPSRPSRSAASSFRGGAPESAPAPAQAPAAAKPATRRAPARPAATAAPAKPAATRPAAAKPAAAPAKARAATRPAAEPAAPARKAAAKPAAAPAKAPDKAPAKAPAKAAATSRAAAPAKAKAAAKPATEPAPAATEPKPAAVRRTAAAKAPAQEEPQAPARRKWPSVLG